MFTGLNVDLTVAENPRNKRDAVDHLFQFKKVHACITNVKKMLCRKWVCFNYFYFRIFLTYLGNANIFTKTSKNIEQLEKCYCESDCVLS